MISMIDNLMDPGALPDRTKSVRLIQTHISFVLVADDFVYKIKKPVDFGFLDFSTIDKRKYYCQREIELNSRFSQDLYLGVLPVFFDGKGYKIGEKKGEVVDYTVKMRRLPDNILMKSYYERGALQDSHLKEIAKAIAGFHLKAQRNPEIDKFGEPDVFKFTTDENFEQTEKYQGITIREKDFKSIRQWTDRYFEENRGLFFERIKTEKIRDCHGDLHMEHVCLTSPVSMFDCIEFNDRLRYTDVLADIGFLLMDLEYRGGRRFADTLWKSYSEITGDGEMMSLLSFYKVYRAYVRGKVNSFQIDDEQIDTVKKREAAECAGRYFQLALDYIS